MSESKHSPESIYAFRRAYGKALPWELWQGLRGRPADLLPFNVVATSLHLVSRVPIGIQQVPLSHIIGSVDRAGDFTRSYLPRREYLMGRWARVHAYVSTYGFDPPSLHKVSQVYFVEDGNHRLSVLRALKATTVEARVTEYACRVPLEPDLRISDLPRKAAFNEFLEQTNLDRERPVHTIDLSHPASYRKLEEYVAGHAYWLQHSTGRPVSVFRAATSWYDLVFEPTMALIRERRLGRDFPCFREADLYIGLTEYHGQLARGLGRPVPLLLAVEQYRMSAARPKIRRLWYHLTRRRRYSLADLPEMPVSRPGRRLFDVLPTRKAAPGKGLPESTADSDRPSRTTEDNLPTRRDGTSS